MKHRISAGVLLEDQGRVLLVRHCLPGRYGFWVAPGGGVEGTETLTEAAEREAREETGLQVRATTMRYVEEFHSPDSRHCKFWFAAQRLGTDEPRLTSEVGEHIVDVGWFGRAEIARMTVYPLLLRERYWADRDAGITTLQHLGLRAMDQW